jgi:hypothetical protein
MTTLMRVLAATLVGLVGLAPPARAGVLDAILESMQRNQPAAALPGGPPADAPQGPATAGPGQPTGVAWCVIAETRCPLPAGTPRGQKCWCQGVSQ